MMESSKNGNRLSADQQEQLLFMMLIQQHQQIAMMGLGKVKNPSTDKIERDLKSAKFAIDTLNMIQKFTGGNLPKELEGYLNQTLTTLRLNYADEKKKGDEASDGGEEKKIQPIDAAGGVLYRKAEEGLELLLIRRKGVWDLPKGKRETHEAFEDCALREVEEETGAEGLILEEHLVDTYHEYEQEGTCFGKTTRWYAMRFPEAGQMLTPQLEEEITDLQWMSAGLAQKAVGFRNLSYVIGEFRNLKNG